MQSVELIGADELGRTLTALEREVFPQAAARAINTTTTTVRSRQVRQIAKKMGVQQKVVRDRSSIKRATPKKFEEGSQLSFKGRSLNLIRFKARQAKRGVSATPGGKRQVFPQTFLVNLGTGQFVGVRKATNRGTAHEPAASLRRTTRVGRIPVVGVVGPGVAATAAETDVMEERRKLVAELLPTRLSRELQYYASRLRT